MFCSLGKRVALILSLGFILLQYQNCSSVPSHLLNNNVAFANDSGMGKADINPDDEGQQVGVIDPVSVGPISFPQTEVSVEQENESLTFIGVCEQNGSMIGWKLSQGDELIERGLATCETGSFEITVSHSWQDYCGEDGLTLSAALGAKASAEIHISNPCLDSE